MTIHSARHLGACALVLAGFVATLTAQASAPWVDQWTAAQTHRPVPVLNHARIAAIDEPGVPLVIHGLVLAPDGKTPVKDAIVFAYQTDHDGLYRVPGQPETPWRLQGWARTDSQGRFEFETIRPAPYPNRQVPAHIHTTYVSEDHGRQGIDLMFEDDHLATPEYRKRFASVGERGLYGSVQTTNGVQHVNYVIRLQEKSTF